VDPPRPSPPACGIFAAGEASERSIALRLRNVAVDVLGAHARFQEFIADMDDLKEAAGKAPALERRSLTSLIQKVLAKHLRNRRLLTSRRPPSKEAARTALKLAAQAFAKLAPSQLERSSAEDQCLFNGFSAAGKVAGPDFLLMGSVKNLAALERPGLSHDGLRSAYVATGLDSLRNSQRASASPAMKSPGPWESRG
jgi:hypothetical protein